MKLQGAPQMAGPLQQLLTSFLSVRCLYLIPGYDDIDVRPSVRFVPTWMPGAGFKRHALKVRQIIREASHRPYEATKAAVVSDSLP